MYGAIFRLVCYKIAYLLSASSLLSTAITLFVLMLCNLYDVAVGRIRKSLVAWTFTVRLWMCGWLYSSFTVWHNFTNGICLL